MIANENIPARIRVTYPCWIFVGMFLREIGKPWLFYSVVALFVILD